MTKAKPMTIGKMVDILTKDMAQEDIGLYIENIITYKRFKDRGYTFRQILETEIRNMEDYERMIRDWKPLTYTK